MNNLHINEVTQRVINVTRDTLGDQLDKIILFGSYARGDFDDESDIDFCILANVPQSETGKLQVDIRKRLQYIDLEYDVLVSLHVTGRDMFYNNLDILPYYMNIQREGVVLHG